ncbi:MAG: CotH kinase family protein [Paludibacteraceae bacterium]|nr:CotH kinase family protein [Paludibacteraceae bacterium]
MKGSIKSCFLAMKVNICFLLFLLFSLADYAQGSETIAFTKQPPLVSIVQKGQSITLVCKAEKEGLPISYQWYQSTNANSIVAEKITGATSETLLTVPFFNKEIRYYYCVATAIDGESITSDVAVVAYTGLPTVYIDIDVPLEQVTKESYVLGSMKVVSEGMDTYQYKFYKTDKDGMAKEGIKGRGNSTWWGNLKRSYNIKFDKKQTLFNLPKAKKWCINASYLDKSLLRDKFASILGNEVFNAEWNPHFVSVDVVVNGEYIGNYILGEKNTIGKGRIDIQDIDDFTEEKIQSRDYVDQNQDGVIDIKDGGYVLELDARMDAPYFFQTSRLAAVSFKDPDEVSDTVFNYVKSFVQEAEDLLYTRKFIDLENGWRKYYDEASAIDWYLMNEIANNRDAKDFSSIFKYYDPTDGKLHFGPNWDFDLGYGNDGENGNVEHGKSMGWWVRDGVWIARMFEDPAFFENVKKRWDDKKSALYEAINTRLQLLADENAISAECNFKKWKILGQYLNPNPAGYEERTTYQSEVDYMKNWLNERFAWFDEALHNSYCITYELNGGTFPRSNPRVFISESSQTVILIEPVKEGFVFAGWTGTGIDGIAKTVTISDDRKGDRKYIALWENDIESCTVTMKDTVYTGSPYTPEIVVKYGDSLLTPEVDYSVVLPEGRVEAGDYAVTIVGKGNYRGEQVVHFTIAKVPLTITAQPVALIYGDEPHDNGVLYSGFVNKDTESVLRGTLSFEYSYSQFDGIGEYTLTPYGLESDNYDISYVGNLLSVAPKEIGITWADTVFPYNGREQFPSAILNGLVNGDTCELLFSSAQSQVGTYLAKVEALGNANYLLPEGIWTKEVTITKVPLTVTAQPVVLAYGDMPHDSGVLYSGFVNGETEDVLDGSLSFEYTYSQFDGIGEYSLVPYGWESNNYDISYTGNTLVVNPKEIKVVWLNSTFIYNGSEQVVDAIVDGLVNGDRCEISVEGAQINAGTYVAEVTGIDNANYCLPRTGLEKEFSIHSAPLQNIVIEVDSISFVCDGVPKTPAVVVKDGENVIPAEEYSVVYLDNLNEGVAKIAIIDKEGGNYVVRGSTTFLITKAEEARVWSGGQRIYIENVLGTDYKIFDIHGCLIIDSKTKSKREEIVMGKSGVFIVMMGNRSYMVVI